jgi:hypothetical protein
LLEEGLIEDYDGFTVPRPRPPEGLDLNRNFPAGWGTGVAGSGDHPLSEPEIDALVRAIVARPNVCGFNAYHTSGGILLRPSSTGADSTLPPDDLWTWTRLAERATELTGYPAHSTYEDFTWDTSETQSGASDDWAYEHLGVFSWTTEFWDVIRAATGNKASTHLWFTGPTATEALAVLRWLDGQPGDAQTAGFVDWYPFDHPQLGPVELGGWNQLHSWTNPPMHLLLDEVDRHADFAVFQALASPRLEIKHARVELLGADGDDPVWRVELGVSNTGWLPTHVSARAKKDNLVRPIVVEIAAASGVSIDVVGSSARQTLGQLEGLIGARPARPDAGTPQRALVAWTIRAAAGTDVTLSASHERAGRDVTTVRLE